MPMPICMVMENNVIVLADYLEKKNALPTFDKDEFTYFDLKKDQIMWRRVGAFCADFFIILTLFNMMQVAYAQFVNTFMVPMSNAQKTQLITDSIVLNIVLFATVYVAYFFVANFIYEGQSFGKKWMKLKVINEDYIYFKEVDDYQLSFSQSIRRSFGKFLCYASFCTFFILNFINEEKRGISDMVSKTRVVSEEWFDGFKANKKYDLEDVKIDINSLDRVA